MSGTIQNKARYVHQNRTYKYLVVPTDDSNDGDEEEGDEGAQDKDSEDKEGQRGFARDAKGYAIFPSTEGKKRKRLMALIRDYVTINYCMLLLILLCWMLDLVF